GGCELIVVIGGHRGVALLLRLLRARGELLAALARVGLRLVAVCRVLPLRRLLAQAFVGAGRFDLLGGGAQHGLPDGLRLEEGPEVRGLDVVGERAGLRALAERLGEGEHQRKHGYEERYALVAAEMVVAAAMTVSMPR